MQDTKKIVEESKEQVAASLIRNEKAAFENVTVQVSDDASFNMRDQIDTNRKNYFGIYEEPTDKDSGLSKLWIPLSEWTVETIVKNTDIDLKNLLIKAPMAKKTNVGSLMRQIVTHFLRLSNFGEFLNDLIRRLAIDGTVVAKCVKQYSKEYKRNLPKLSLVDVLNVIIDPTSYSIHDVPIIQRSVMNQDEIEAMDWMNKDKIAYSKKSIPDAVIYERHGLIPKFCLTGVKEDMTKWVNGIIIASSSAPYFPNTQSPSQRTVADSVQVIHKIEEWKKPFKPFEECWYTRVPNRWHGRSPVEMIAGLQTWLNTVVNVRRDEILNKLSGKFKYRKGVGITRQMLESIKSGGAIPVDEMDDIMPLMEQDVQASAYREPMEIIAMSERVTGASPLSRGEELPPSMPATSAILQSRGASTGYALTQENIGMFIERLMKRHFIPIIIECLKEGDIEKITGDTSGWEQLDEHYINSKYNKEIFRKLGRLDVPSPEEEAMFKEVLKKDLKKMGKDRDVKIAKKYLEVDYDVEIEVSDEKFDKTIMVRNLVDLLATRAPNFNTKEAVKEIVELMGMNGSRFIIDDAKVQVPEMTPRNQNRNVQTEFNRANVEGVMNPRATANDQR